MSVGVVGVPPGSSAVHGAARAGWGLRSMGATIEGRCKTVRASRQRLGRRTQSRESEDRAPH